MLPDPFPVVPWTAPCRGEVRLPGSKSLTNRAMVLGALGQGTTRLSGALFSRDTLLLVDCLRALGYSIEADGTSATLAVQGSGIPPRAAADLFVGNAGTAARFLTALVCLHPRGQYRMDGDPEMRRRPMRGLTAALAALGARFVFEDQDGCLPFTVHTRGLPGGAWTVDAAASSQMLSALLMVAPLAAGPVHLRASGARPEFVRMTTRLMARFGVPVEGDAASGYRIPSGHVYRCPLPTFPIEPDATAASYFLLLPFVTGGALAIPGFHDGMLQGDIAFAGVLESLGMRIDRTPAGWTVSFPSPPDPRPRTFCFRNFSDTFLTLAAVAPLFPCPITVTGIGHTRHQETDRIAAMARELAKTGAPVREEPDALAVGPFASGRAPAALPVRIDTHKDHRIAMAFAILGCARRFGTASPWLTIADPACCGKTFPGFFDELLRLHRISHDV